MDLSKLSLKELREIAKEKGLSGVSGLRKADLVHELEKLTRSDARTAVPSEEYQKRERTAKRAEGNAVQTTEKEEKKKQTYTYVPNHGDRGHTRNSNASIHRSENRQDNHLEQQESQPLRTIEDVVKAGLITIARDRQVSDVHPREIKELDSGITKRGILEIMPEGYGFIRCDNFLPGENDVYVSPAFLRRFGLRTGDIVEGNIRVKTQNEKFSALLYMKSVNGRPITYLVRRHKFEDLTPIFPNERIHLETPGAGVSMRMLDLIAPIGKGQRGMIVSQPKTGKDDSVKTGG